MKRIKILLILCGALVLLALIYLLITIIDSADPKDPPDSETDPPINTTYTAAQIDIGTMYALRYNVGNEEYCFMLNDEHTAWNWGGNASLPLDSTCFAEMATSLEKVNTQLKMTVSSSELAVYGLDDPWLNIVVSDEKYGTQTFHFGDLNSFTGQYYFSSASDNGAVYMVDSSIPPLFSRAPQDMILNDTLPTVSAGSISSLTFNSSDDIRIYTYYESGKDDDAETADYWYVSRNGGEETAVDEAVSEKIGDMFDAIAFDDLVGSTSAERTACGLGEATLLTVAYTEEKSVTDTSSGATSTFSVSSTLELLLGYSDEDGNIYAGLRDSVLSYRINGSVLSLLYKTVTAAVC